MSKADTVLILGAGASRDYGLPVGRELLADIKNTLRGTPQHQLVEISEGRFTPNDFENLLYALERKYTTRTIDEYLRDADERQRELGKLLIAHALLRSEQAAVNRAFGGMERDWLEALETSVFATAPEHRHRLGIVTFNYDRLVEYQLLSRMMADAFQRGSELNSNAHPVVTIEHVHGTLGDVAPTRNWCVGEFREGLTQGRIRAAVQSISIVAEPNADPAFARARSMIATSRRILFMGFGFDPKNLERLGMVESSKIRSKQIAATCRSVDDTARRTVEGAIGKQVEWLNDRDCLDAFRWLEDPFRSLE